MATLMNTGEIGSQQDPDFFQDDNDIPKKIKKKTAKSNYSNTKVKARNLLTNDTEDINKRILTTQTLLLTFYHF